MALTDDERELVSIGASVAVGCELCVDVHVRDARKLGVGDEDIERALSIALGLRDEATRVMKRRGLGALGRLVVGRDDVEDTTSSVSRSSSRTDELVSVGAAYALNCEPALERHAAVALSLGVTEEELGRTVRLAKFIRGKAESLCCKWM